MKSVQTFVLFLSIFLLVPWGLSGLAASVKDEDETITLFDVEAEEITVFADEQLTEEQDVLPHETEVYLRESLDSEAEVLYIYYFDEEDRKEGYVAFEQTSLYASEEQDVEQGEKKETEDEEETEQVIKVFSADLPTIEAITLHEETKIYAEPTKDASIVQTFEQGKILEIQEIDDNWYLIQGSKEDSFEEGYLHKEALDFILDSGETLRGHALNEEVSVYKQPTKNSTALKTYQKGHALKYESFSAHWYKAVVYINGKRHGGYIAAEDVGEEETTVAKATATASIEGIALKEPTNVYEQPSKNAKPLKSYSQGHILKFRPYEGNWYIATVYVNGVRHTGYIHTGDVDRFLEQQETVYAYGLKQPVAVYEEMSRDAFVLKAYNYGHRLKLRTYTENWYEAVVIVDGVRHSGYVAAEDVGQSVEQAPSMQGVALKQRTSVYAGTSRDAKVLKSYDQGRILKYRAYNANWYSATVYLNGIRHTGYIHKNDVDSIVSTSQTLNGIALQNNTKVYAAPNTKAKVHKSYKKGHVLKYRTFTNHWYEATVYVNGERKTGYIHHESVLTSNGRTVVLDAGHGGSDQGASGQGIIEKDLTLDLAKRTQRVLEDAGFTVIMTRSDDRYISLAERSKIANEAKADLFISIHGNAFNGSVKGVETYWYDKYAKEESRQLAELLQEEMILQTNNTDRGVKKGNFHVIRETKIPSALLEVGFIDHPEDAENLKKNSFKNRIARGILNAVQKFISLLR